MKNRFFNGFGKAVTVVLVSVAVMVFTGCEQDVDGGSSAPALSGEVTIDGVGAGGAVTEGTTLTANVTELNVPEKTPDEDYAYKWQKKAADDEAYWTDIAEEVGGVAKKYTPAHDDVGSALRVSVSANGYSGSVESEATAAVTAAATAIYRLSVKVTTDGGALTAKVAGSEVTMAEEGATVTLTVTPDAGYTLTENGPKVNGGAVQVSGNYPEYFFTMPAADVTVSAAFGLPPPNTHLVTIDHLSGGSVLSDKPYAAAWETVTLTVTPDEGYKFKWGSLRVNYGAVEVSGDDPQYFFTMPAADVTVSAEFEPLQWYTITFSVGEGDGTAPASQTVDVGAEITLPVQGSMTPPHGKAFAGWKADGDDRTYAAGDPYTVDGDVTFIAQWTQYTATFDAGESTGSAPPSQTVDVGTVITLPDQENMDAPTGKGFAGWKADGTGETYAAGASYTVNDNVTFTAQWITQYTATFDAGAGSGSAPASQTVNAGTAITLPVQGSMNPPLNKTFAGWKADVTGKTYAERASYTVNGNVTFTAQWTNIQYTITFDAGAGTGSAPSSRTVSAGMSIYLPGQGSMTAPLNKTFAGWKADGGATTYAANDPYKASGNVTLIAQWKPIQYTVTFNRGAGGGTAPASQTVDAGTAITLPNQGSMTPPDSKVFMGWTADGGATTYAAGTPYTASGNVTLTAHWVLLNTFAYIEAYLAAASGGESAADPVYLPVTLDLASDWTTLLSLIKTAGKYVALDLSACTMTGSKYDPGAANTGESKIVSLVLPNVATSIKNGSQAALGFNATFRYFTALKSISGSSIISTGDYVFADCDSLTTVNFPKAETIGDYAFSSCDSLTTVDFPKAVTIGNSAFEFCENLTTVSFPKVTSIGRNAILYEGYAFSHCTNLTTAIFPEATSIKAEAFSNCDSLITVSFPEATSIGDGAFANCDSLTTATFPLATIIGSAAFYRCDSLTSVSFPEATSIGDSAFYYCSLATVNIPKATSIGEYAFGGVGTAVPLTVTLGSAAPTLGVKLFDNADYLNGVTVKVPAGATGYGTVPKTYSGSDTEVCWGNGFRGGGWNGSAFTGDASDINSYITLKIEPK